MDDVALAARLAAHGLLALEEAELRKLLDSHAQTWTLVRLAPAARRRWKAHYRLMVGDRWFDAHTVAGAYAAALAWLLDRDEPTDELHPDTTAGGRPSDPH